MKTRYVLDNSGGLVDRNGERLGRVVSITIDDGPAVTTARLGDGERRSSLGATDDPSGAKGQAVVPHTPRPTATQLERAAVQRVWDYWLVVSEKRQKLDSKRERIIRNAIKLVGEDPTKAALLGLSRSPWHNGTNPDRKTYLEVRYALKGIGDESDDERIEKARLWAQLYAPGHDAVDEAKVQRWLGDVQYTLSLPHRPERERATTAFRNLRRAGFEIVQLDKSPWARLTR